MEEDNQQQVIEQWFEQLGEECDAEGGTLSRDLRKLDGYAALIGEMQARAEARNRTKLCPFGRSRNAYQN
ncbi:hypothetical protein B7486_53515 [cyanobacterium TDX16]|nr:hypothetical protein B7486_53515 [cyanobacterium TDX16]